MEDSTSTEPTVNKLSGGQYHNPDPVVRLIGEASKIKIKIDNVGCFALVDLGAQLSTITVDYIQHLKLPTYKLDQFIKVKATGGGKNSVQRLC